jgi:hypothetical protein
MHGVLTRSGTEPSNDWSDRLLWLGSERRGKDGSEASDEGAAVHHSII